ncbi:MAG: hypothetical protein QM722_00185 [Piscinibacter sp.]
MFDLRMAVGSLVVLMGVLMICSAPVARRRAHRRVQAPPGQAIWARPVATAMLAVSKKQVIWSIRVAF